ncbi:MAG: hypothetical protein SVE93_06915, partial [Candidatus Thermoplasmatota archaeon]|nr:hypothetical protein [Candidatus Thermoplasmatota archaeon]
IILSPFIGIFLVLMMPVNLLFIFFLMFLPVILASFADVSSFELPESIQTILNDIGSRGTLTEITFAYFKNLWSIVRNLPEIARLIGDLNTEDYANLIKSFGSLFLDYPSNLRALPDKILRNLFPVINALPAWLRQSPVLLQVFPLLPIPIGPQAVKSYPAVFRLFLSLAENSIAIPLGIIALPLSALLSVFRGLPNSLRAVFYHLIDFVLTLPIFPMRALPLTGTFVVLLVLWTLGFGLALLFSPFLLIAPVFIVIALFVGGISTDTIRDAIENLPENVGKVDEVIMRIAEMCSNVCTTDISGLLDALTGVEWLIATQNLPDVLPEAVQEVGSAIPAIINSGPEIIKTLINSGTNILVIFAYDILGAFTTLIRDIFAIIWAMPELAILIPQLLEILSVITINLPALIRGFIPAAVDAVEQTTISLPELLPSIVLSTMGLNVIVLQFARAIWDVILDIVEMTRKFLWSLILFLPASVFDFDEFVTPWFGPRLLSVIGLACGAIPSSCIGGIAAIVSLLISGCLILGMIIYLPLMVILAILTFTVSVLQMITSIASLIVSWVPELGSIVNALIGLVDSINAIITSIQLLTDILLPLFFFILVIIALFPLIGLAAALLILAIIYFIIYIIQIMFGFMLMACSGVFNSIVFVPLMSLCEPVPVVSTLLGYMRTLTSFYAFFIPPNVIEIITQMIPLCVNILASLPALIFMPISLLQTLFGTASAAVEALPSVPAYLGRLTDRIIFSILAECFAVISLIIDIIVALLLICFACATGWISHCLTLDILTAAPTIAVLVFALICVTFAWLIDLCGVMC